MTAKCPICLSPATLRCSRCKSVSYCSPTCQSAHWLTHKLPCHTHSAEFADPAFLNKQLQALSEGIAWEKLKQDEHFQLKIQGLAYLFGVSPASNLITLAPSEILCAAHRLADANPDSPLAKAFRFKAVCEAPSSLNTDSESEEDDEHDPKCVNSSHMPIDYSKWDNLDVSSYEEEYEAVRQAEQRGRGHWVENEEPVTPHAHGCPHASPPVTPSSFSLDTSDCSNCFSCRHELSGSGTIKHPTAALFHQEFLGTHQCGIKSTKSALLQQEAQYITLSAQLATAICLLPPHPSPGPGVQHFHLTERMRFYNFKNALFIPYMKKMHSKRHERAIKQESIDALLTKVRR